MDQIALFAKLQIPSFSEHYEPLLVEEIALVRHPALVHYGKCSLIGYLPEQNSSLESLLISSLPRGMQLPDGTCSVPLCFENYRGAVPRSCTVRVYGSVQLQGPSHSAHRNSRDLICSLIDLKKDCKKRLLSDVDLTSMLKAEWESMESNYQPILSVQGCERVNQATELICCNLRLKRINKRLEPRLRDIETGI